MPPPRFFPVNNHRTLVYMPHKRLTHSKITVYKYEQRTKFDLKFLTESIELLIMDRPMGPYL